MNQLTADARAISKWSKASRGVPILWKWTGSLPQLSDVEVRTAIAEAFASWSKVANLHFREVGTPGEKGDIVLTSGPIDGSGKVLAWSELPDGSDRPLQQKYDTSEAFIIAVNPPRQNIDLVAVLCHEIGHALGLDHDQVGTKALMEPTYAPGRRVPQSNDIKRIQSLYGPSVSTPPPTSPGVDPVVIRVFGADRIEIPGYKVTRQ